MAVNSISGFNSIPSLSKIGLSNTDKADSVEGSFANYLKDALTNVSNLEKESTALTEDFAAGKTDNIHQVMIAAEKADVALQFTMQIRNKIMDAYKEIMNMQV
ncbi:flagellar hook-basal body complex protein FliE [Acetivibrio cellulolyticus]|uniref:flagellar hook-basal body complex protein FliE n=1 Tax=Acetivibrio cellulolyticus TaxID=35830 RepID=UPI0001E2C250|nr:flagellar hook-basal body complex protein FliE [Acetivibrio cellulolyticus]